VPLLAGWKVSAGEVIFLMGLALTVQVLIGLLFLESRLFRPITIDWALTERMAKYSAPLLLSFSAGYLSDWMDVYLLRAFRATAEVGVYHVAYQGMLLVSSLLAGVTTLAFPLLIAWRAEGSDQQARNYLERLVPQAAVCWGLFISGVGLAAGFAFPFLFGPGFEEGSRYFCLLLVGTVFQVVSYFYSPIFSSYDILGRATRILFVMALVNFVIDLLLIPSWGSMGAALATAASYTLGATLYLVFGNRRLHVRRTAALVPPCLAVAPLLAAGAGFGFVPQLVLFLLFGGAILGWAKQRQVYHRADLIMFERVKLPKTIRAGMVKTYEVLS
jgi:O-antigen/teichoic acid export membrane protein